MLFRSRKVMLKLLQARLPQYVNHELPDSQAGFRKGIGTRDQIANTCWIIKKVREFQKNMYFCFIDYAKASDCVDHNKLWKILKEMGIPDHLTCLLRNLYVGQETTIRPRRRLPACCRDQSWPHRSLPCGQPHQRDVAALLQGQGGHSCFAGVVQPDPGARTPGPDCRHHRDLPRLSANPRRIPARVPGSQQRGYHTRGFAHPVR